jgi:predicted transcriptional regulator
MSYIVLRDTIKEVPMSSASESVTLRIPVEVLSDIEAIAEATERSRSYIIVRALKTYLLNEGADIFASIKGHEQIAAGEYEDIDDVISDMDRIIAGKVA